MITPLALETIEKVVNRYLSLAPESLSDLSLLQGKTLAINITNWKIHFYIQIRSHGICLLSSCPESPCAEINGPLSSLLQLTRARSLLYSPDIRIVGDMEFVQSLNHIFRNIDIDWGEHLSQIVGDGVAHQLSVQGRKLKSWLSSAINAVKENSREFIQEEAKLSPSATEINDFYHDIAILRDDVERMELKINRLITHNRES